jgi:hypothetical protein
MIIMTILSIMVFSISNMLTLLLPLFIKNNLLGTSELYGYAESIWSTGALISSIALTILLGSKFILVKWAIYCLLLLSSIFTSIPLIHSSNSLIVACFIMGTLFSITKILIEGHVLTICPNELICRVRNFTSTFTSLVGLIIFITPRFFIIENVTLYFLLYGGIMLTASIILILSKHKLS